MEVAVAAVAAAAAGAIVAVGGGAAAGVVVPVLVPERVLAQLLVLVLVLAEQLRYRGLNDLKLLLILIAPHEVIKVFAYSSVRSFMYLFVDIFTNISVHIMGLTQFCVKGFEISSQLQL